MKALVLMVKPTQRPLCWLGLPARTLCPGQHLWDTVPQGSPPLSPSALYPSMHPPPAQRAGTGAKLPSDCPRGEALLSSLEQDPGSPKKHEVMTTTATTHEHLLGALPMLRAILPSMRHSTEVHPHFTEEDPGDHTVYLPVNNKVGSESKSVLTPKTMLLPFVCPNCVAPLEGPRLLNPN